MPPDSSQPLRKAKKPASCDRCKAKRVLCHPAPPGQSCPRCAENQVSCTTTPVKRRPRGSVPAEEKVARSRRSASQAVDASLSRSTTPNAPPWHALAPCPSMQLADLPPELAQNLYTACWSLLPQAVHPDIPDLRATLDSVGWRTSLLPLPSQALSFAIFAHGAIVSTHASIIGPGLPAPGPPDQIDLWPTSTDWASFGRRRQSMCSALREEAFRLAREADVAAEFSDPTCAAVCFLLDCLDNGRPHSANPARPYAVSYLAHVRTMAEHWDELDFTVKLRWSAFLAGEALHSISTGAPILFTQGDQRMLHGTDIWTPEQLIAHLRNSATLLDPSVIFKALRPYAKHVISLARRIDEAITGAYARRHPLDEASVIDCVAGVKQLDIVHSLVLERLAALAPIIGNHVVGTEPSTTAPQLRLVFQAVRSFFTLGFTTPVLAVHHELQRRAGQVVLGVNGGERERERNEATRGEVLGIARRAAREWARGSREQPTFGHLSTSATRPEDWARILMTDVEDAGQLSMENREALESILRILKLLSFSYVDPSLDLCITAIEVQLLPLPLLHSLDLAPPFFDTTAPPTSILLENALTVQDPTVAMLLAGDFGTADDWLATGFPSSAMGGVGDEWSV